MAEIIIKGLRLKAYHGVNPEEKENGQMFEIDVTADVNIKKSQISDCVEDTVSYAKVIKTVRRVFTENCYDLLETAVYKIETEILNEYPKVESVTVCVKKPEAPIKADFDYVAVKDTLTRNEQAAGELRI